FTGNSNSLAQLVDNEIPLSQMDVPANQLSGTGTRSASNAITNSMRQFRHHKQRVNANDSNNEDDNLGNMDYLADDIDDPDVVVVGNTEVVAAVAAIAATNRARERHNLSGSYNNLFNAEYDTNISPTSPISDTSIAIDPLSVDDAQRISNQISPTAKVLLAAAAAEQQHHSNHRLAKSISQTENMYCNVPNVAVVDQENPIVNNTNDSAALHVYSNLIDERHQQQQQILPEQQQTQHIVNTTAVLPSTLLSDDLDLDDPVTASFVANVNSNSTQTRHFTKRKNNIGTEVKPAADVAELVVTNKMYTSSGHVTNDTLSPSRLRLLHDTTMIDTALDLDSLDGSSLGNNSQTCLVKTVQTKKT
ncbi:palmitoyltransferase app-like, partial [Teleopsis dalmanni]|uniref:palmitoyltransferase app-like n=1 Tax=Teleopsis dalmanni TaxID=139649 RepID=UPI0018CF272E